ncbi:GIY-YIG nuclease family protein [Bacillus spizizenii]
MEEEYKYRYNKLPITPTIIEDLIIGLFNGKTVKRDEIVTKVLNHHKINGGLPPEAKDFSRSVKRALENMAKKEWVTNRSYGFWEVNKRDLPVIEDNEGQEEDVTKVEEIPAHAVYGNGISAVYLYYFDSYKKLSLLQNNRTWPCKIGRTDRDPIIRILSQVSTALPETPTIEYIIKTDDASLLETMLHSILKVRGKQIENSPGLEWFDTNPDEVIELVDFANKKLLDS